MYVIIYTKEYGRQELTREQYHLNFSALTFHREDGPAKEFLSGELFYYVNNQVHNIHGPAYITNNRYSKSQVTYALGNEIYNKKQHTQILEEVRNMHPALRLTDPRWWVREWKDE